MEPTMEAGVEGASGARALLGPVVQIDEGRIREHLDEVVRSTVEETLNALLDAEADQLCGARKYERTEGRKDTRAGSYDRHLQTKAGEVTLTVPKLRNLPFETAIIERYRRRESSVEEALIEMYLAGVSVRRVEDITQALWGTRVSASTVSDLNQKIYGKMNEWRLRPLVARFSVCLSRWPLAEAELGRRGEERLSAGGHWRGAERLPGDSGGERRRQGGHRELDQLSARDEAARPEGCGAVCLRQVPGAGREPGGLLPRGQVAALCGALLPQRVDRGAHRQGEGSGCDAQGHSRTGRRQGS